MVGIDRESQASRCPMIGRLVKELRESWGIKRAGINGSNKGGTLHWDEVERWRWARYPAVRGVYILAPHIPI